MNLDLVALRNNGPTSASNPSRSTESSATPQTPQTPAPAQRSPEILHVHARKRSLSISTSADPRRRKVSRACDLCKAKKAKCSGTQPCESCAKRGVDCLYEARYSRGKPPTPPQADERIRFAFYAPIPKLQSPVEIRASTEHHILPRYPHPYPSPQSRHLPTLTPAPPSLVETEKNIQPTTQPAPKRVEPPSHNSPELEVAGQYSDSTSGLSFLHRAWRRLSNNQNSQLVSVLASSEVTQRLMAAGDKPFHDQGAVVIPPLPKAQELLRMYFDVCIATYRLLHRPTVERWLEDVVLNFELKRPLSHGLSRPKSAIVLAVLAIAAFHEEKARGPTSSFSPVNPEPPLRQCDELFCEASQLTDAETGFPTLESAQARLIQVLYLLMSSRMNQAWYTFGNALQIISALGLHRRENRKRPSQKRNYIEEQCRKRTFWVAYTLDKYLGVIFGRPRHYHDDDIDQDFPDLVNDEDMTPTGALELGSDDCHIESLVVHAKLAQIAEKISREVYSIKPVPDLERIAASHRLGGELRQWRTTLPPFLGVINPSSLIPSLRRQATALKLAYSHAVILAHRPFLLKNFSGRDDVRALAKESIRECIAAAQVVLESVDRTARDGHLFHAFWWTHYVCFCALVVVYVWAIQQNSYSEDDTQSYERLFDLAERCLGHLTHATATNSPSRRYSIILQELRAEAKRKTTRRLPDSMSLHGSEDSARTQMLHSHVTTPGLMADQWEPMFGSPIDSTSQGLPNLLDDWQTTDWLDLDSSAFGPFPAFDNPSITWMTGIPRQGS
ncbi:hypothetical protein P154DRAFT_263159 [Amniculicola lignicola CBS 123094]|uniref:Zn(2)-C6 fungal-type domain-containing protein n=1 Tax=Amniculicola lignicola CBS 123094 TaxID=1392246 RepID=A0A6A5WBG0_9PLEO|nr:hypothetical protein P154DRAFT_263159 [Amniculicola lignicola CBS 123094]